MESGPAWSLKEQAWPLSERADWDQVPTPAVVTCLFTWLYFKTQGQLPIPWDSAPPGNIRCFHSMTAVIWWCFQWEELLFLGKDQPIIWELAISSSERMTFFSINYFSSAIFSHKSLWAMFLLYFQQMCEGTSKPNLAKVKYFQEAGTFFLFKERYLTK